MGYTTLRTGDFRLQPVHIHPPLANVLAGAPLLLQDDLPDPRAVDGWDINSLSAITDAVVWQYPHPARIATAGRVPILLLGILLGALVFRWAKDLGGTRAGLLALALYALDPNILTHSALITTDIGATLLIVATLYVVQSCKLQVASCKPNVRRQVLGTRRLFLTGVLLGLAQLTKVSTLMLIPVVGFIILIQAIISTNAKQPAVTFPTPFLILNSQLLIHSVLLVFFPAALILWAGYGFQITAVPGFPIPIPAGTHIRIFQSLYAHYGLGHPTFALGQVSAHGWRWYFPLAFVIKTPLPTLILAVWAALHFMSKVKSRKSKVKPPLSALLFPLSSLLFPILYIAASLFSTVNIGYRHLLPVLPFLYIGIGQMVRQAASGKQQELLILHLASCILFLWLALGTLHTRPYPLAFFNELVGGSTQGYRYLVDSNLDWGQNLWDLKEWMVANDADHIYYAHYSPAHPATYGIAADFLPPDPRAVDFAPWNPAPGRYAIGATVLQGPYMADLNTYAWFRARAPDAKLGDALFIYRVPPRPAPTWAVLCNDAGIGADALAPHLGTDVARVLWLDCAQAQIYPADAGPGLYVTHATVPITGSRELTLRDAQGTFTGAVYRVETPPRPNIPIDNVNFDGPLDLVGYAMRAPEQLWTYWRVREIPSRPLSLMAHHIAPDGTAAAVGDGMGVPIAGWQVSDLIVQHHDLRLPPDAAPGAYTIHIGGYWLDTMGRWTTDTGETYLELESITVAVQNGE